MPYKDIDKQRACQHKSYLKNKEKIRETRKKNKPLRLTRLGTTGKIIHGLHKRPYPIEGVCELCNTIQKRLVYHHWDDNDYNKGMWICSYCHMFTERQEDGFNDIYIKLKEKITLEMPEHMIKSRKVYKKDKIIELLKLGVKGVEIARQLGVRRDYVSNLKSRNNIPRIIVWTKDKDCFLLDNYTKVKKIEIAKNLGVSVGAVYARKEILSKLKKHKEKLKNGIEYEYE